MKLVNKKTFQKEAVLLFIASFICFSLSIIRTVITETPMYIFLNWNLFLAFIPWLISSIRTKTKFGAVLAISIWLVFFPNSPYILTDLFHLSNHRTIPLWFDLSLILSFAWTGLLFGLISLRNIEKQHLKGINKYISTLLSSSVLFLCAFGIYLGRYLRWNSWDLIQTPKILFVDIFNRITNPLEHPSTWGMTIIMGILLNLIYFSFTILNNRNPIT